PRGGAMTSQAPLARLDDAGLVRAYLEHARVDKRLAERTLALYTGDLDKLQAFAREAAVPLLQVMPTHVRRWVAQMHSGGRSARGIGLILSGWRGFYGWLGRQGLIQQHPIDAVRAPKAGKPLPKALPVDEAVRLASFEDPEDDPVLEARDACIAELLYGSGLRVGELVGLDLAPSATARGWVDLNEAEAQVLGKGGKRRSVPVGRAALLALQRWLEQRAVFARE